MKFKNTIFILLMFIISIFSACNGMSEQFMSEMDQDKKIESLRKERLDSLRPLWKAYYDNNFDTLVQIKVDSLITDYMQKQPIPEELLTPNSTQRDSISNQ